MLSSAMRIVNRDAVGVPASIGEKFGVAVTIGGDIMTPEISAGVVKPRAIAAGSSGRVGIGRTGRGDASRRDASEGGREARRYGISTENVAPCPFFVTTLS